MGSFALSMGFSTSAVGRASTAFGVCTKAMGEGELALGLYTEDLPSSGIVLRVGSGHESRSPLPQDPLHTSTWPRATSLPEHLSLYPLPFST